jgi:hypothetical protein
MNNPRTFGAWLGNYNGQIQRIHQLKHAFKQAVLEKEQRCSKYVTFNAVKGLLMTGDCLPEWGEDLLEQCHSCWKGGRIDLSARERLALAHSQVLLG